MAGPIPHNLSKMTIKAAKPVYQVSIGILPGNGMIGKRLKQNGI